MDAERASCRPTWDNDLCRRQLSASGSAFCETSDCGLALPEATADDRHPPHRGFLVGKKNFAWFVVDEHGDGRIGLGVRAAPGENEELVATDPERFGLPKYVARHGWVTYYLDLPGCSVDWDEVAELVQESYIIQAPTRLARLLDD